MLYLKSIINDARYYKIGSLQLRWFLFADRSKSTPEVLSIEPFDTAKLFFIPEIIFSQID